VSHGPSPVIGSLIQFREGIISLLFTCAFAALTS
jgi:hypothetical protein